jgi:hypothetical protein
MCVLRASVTDDEIKEMLMSFKNDPRKRAIVDLAVERDTRDEGLCSVCNELATESMETRADSDELVCVDCAKTFCAACGKKPDGDLVENDDYEMVCAECKA